VAGSVWCWQGACGVGRGGVLSALGMGEARSGNSSREWALGSCVRERGERETAHPCATSATNAAPWYIKAAQPTQRDPPTGPKRRGLTTTPNTQRLGPNAASVRSRAASTPSLVGALGLAFVLCFVFYAAQSALQLARFIPPRSNSKSCVSTPTQPSPFNTPPTPRHPPRTPPLRPAPRRAHPHHPPVLEAPDRRRAGGQGGGAGGLRGAAGSGVRLGKVSDLV